MSRSGTLVSLQEAQLIGCVTPGAVQLNSTAGTRPDDFLGQRYLEDFASVRIDDQRVAVGHPLTHAPDSTEEWCAVLARVRPRERLGIWVVLQHARASGRADVVK